MDSEKLNLLAQVANWITTLLVIFTLLEMIRQRKATYKPEVVIGRSNIEAYIGSSDVPNLWFNKALSDEELVDVDSLSSICRVPFYNLGLGSARDLQFVWKFDYEELVERISQLSEYCPFEVEISREKDYLLHIDFPDRYHLCINMKNDLEMSKDFSDSAGATSSRS